MKITDPLYDAAIIGGGLAGLSAAILLAKAGHRVILFEKEKFPFHRVCGEYISMESWNFLNDIGIPLNELQVSIINKLMLTSPSGNMIKANLNPGGFGISRFKLDYLLSELAIKNGVDLFEDCKVEDVIYEDNHKILFKKENQNLTIRSKICFGCFGKRSNLDIKWNRKFLLKHNKKLENYVGIKYHIKTEWPVNLIGLHNFHDGYCGISKIEEEKYCLCYLTHFKNLKKNKNNINEMEKNVLYKNKYIKNIFSNCETLKEFPISISQISFSKKEIIENHILMLGDAAGMITPLCGNGMSIALHSAKIATYLANDFLKNLISREEMEVSYKSQHQRNFSARLMRGRVLQQFFGKEFTSNFLIGALKLFPFLSAPIVRLTHGESF